MALNSEKFSSTFAFFCSLCCLVGLFYGRAILSLGTGGFAILAVYRLVKFPKTFYSGLPIVALFMVLWLAGVSLAKHSHADTLGHEISLRLGFLAILLGLWKQKFSERQNAYLALSLLILSASIATGTFVNYLLNFAEINAQIAKSKPIPIISGYFHISFSYMLGISILFGAWYGFKEVRKLKSWLQWSFRILTGLNFVLIHIIAARTGLVALYAALLIMSFYYFAIMQKEWLKTIVVLSLSLVTLFLAISYIPALHNRYENTTKDLRVYLNDKNPNWWSGTMRLEALENGMRIVSQNPLTGVGLQNLDYSVAKSFEEHGTLLLPENRINPHNQFMNNAIEGGVPAMLLLFVFFVLLFIMAIKTKNILLLGFAMASFVAFNLESLLERQFGACFFALIVSWLASNARFSAD